MSEEKETIYDKLSYIQSKLKAPKGQKNTFGNYKYRSCEDILEAIKPLLKEVNCVLTLTDSIVMIGDRFYVEATAHIFNKLESIHVKGYAREAENKKGMDESQITGACSSYARKYALNGLFCIDDTKDSDATNTHDKEQVQTKAISNAQLSTLRDLLASINAKETGICKHFKVESLEELPETYYTQAYNLIKAKVDKQNDNS